MKFLRQIGGVLIFSKAGSQSTKNGYDESHAWDESNFAIDVLSRINSDAFQILDPALF